MVISQLLRGVTCVSGIIGSVTTLLTGPTLYALVALGSHADLATSALIATLSSALLGYSTPDLLCHIPVLHVIDRP